MKKLFKIISRFKFIIFLVFIVFISVKPLTHYGLPPTHDGEYHIIRFYEFDKALRSGDIYPRWAMNLNNEYGLPLFNYVYPFPNYAASFFHFFGASFINAFKLNLLFATLIGVVFFYLWARLYFDSIASLTAAVFYCFAPYRFVDIYVRGSVGEVWALAWFPAFLWAVTMLIKHKKTDYLIWSGIFFALTIFSHNILGLMFAGFGFTYVLFCLWLFKVDRKIIIFSILSFILGLCLSAIFWLPALVETRFVQNLQLYNINDHFVEIYQLIIPSWGTGFSGLGSGNQMSFQIGVANLVIVTLGFILLIRSKYVFFLVWFILAVFLMLGLSKILWHTIPLLNYFQFPWRFLSLIILICAFIAGTVINTIKNKNLSKILSFLFIFLAVIFSISYTRPAYYHYRDDVHYLSRDNFIHGTNSPGDLFNTIWMNNKLPLKKDRVEIIKGEGKVEIFESKTSSLKLNIIANSDIQLLANISYFPGWKLNIDGKDSQLTKTNEGIIGFSVSKGKHSVMIQFGDTMIRSIGSVISLLSLLACILYFILKKRLSAI